jgi:pimeloyl-ACP methyl ester carboxylesterase
VTAAGLAASAAKIALGVAIGLPAVLYLFQDRLLFFPQALEPGRREALARRAPVIEEVRVAGEDGVALHGWLARATGEGRRPLVIYFGGNAEEVSWILDDPDRPRDWGWLALNYRGYGLSEGSPSERSLVADAQRIYDWAIARPDVDPARIVVCGRSLGSGVATQLAASRRVAGAILVTPYDSMVEVAKVHYPWVPVSLLLRHRFDSLSRAKAIDAPALVLAAERDTLIPPAHAKRLADAWKGGARYVELREADHNSIGGHPDFWRRQSMFLAGR